VERIFIRSLGFLAAPPHRIEPAHHVSTIEIVVSIQVVAGLERFVESCVETPGDTGAADGLQGPALDIARRESAHASGLAHANGEVRVR
jgi:hypothetical protein